MYLNSWTFLIGSLLLLSSCKENSKNEPSPDAGSDTLPLQPIVVTDTVLDDTDDPAIWINHADPSKSLIVGTDKHDTNGGLYVFDLNGRIDSTKSVTGLKRMNNVDIAYGLKWKDTLTDIVVATERGAQALRVFRLPDMQPIDGGGIPVFEGETERDPMGIELYERQGSGEIYAIVGRKSGPAEDYLFQYLLQTNANGQVEAKLVRRFGKFSGNKEIESIAVDNELGYVYYSDEQVGIRKYYADPDSSGRELALFGQADFTDDNEGISFYKFEDGTGYILVSDQGVNRFNIYPREGSSGQPHQHSLIASVPVSAMESDGSETSSFAFPGYETGLFVAMSTDKRFHFYSWEQIAQRAGLKIKNQKT
jgi:3-phytase